MYQELSSNPEIGVKLFSNCYKLRLANSSIPTGKSGGFRVIYYYIDTNNNIILLSIYSKKDKDTISIDKIEQILKENNL